MRPEPVRRKFDPFAEELIRSAALDRSRNGARSRALATLGFAVSSGARVAAAKTATMAVKNGTAAGLASSGAKLAGFVATKWVGVVIVGLATAGVVAMQPSRTPKLMTSSPRSLAAPIQTAFPIPPPRAPTVTAPAEPMASAAVAPVVSPAHVDAVAVGREPATAISAGEHRVGLADQARSLDEIRGRIARGDGASALALLDRFGREHPTSPLGEEALVLRIEALADSGDTFSARSAARRFFERYPDSPYARRVRSVVHDPSVSD